MSRSARSLLLLGVLLPVAAAPAGEDPGAPVVVSRELCSGLFLVPLTWTPDDGEPRKLTAVFDTGGSSSFIDPDALERVSGRRIEPGTRVRFDDMAVGPLAFRTFRPKVRDLDHLSRALGRELDVFLPFQAFAGYLLVLDYPNREMRVFRGTLPEPDGERVFDARGPDDRPWLRIRVGSRGRRVLIDSGSNGGIAIAPGRRLRWAGPERAIHVAQGMNGLEHSEVGRLDGDVVVGPLVFEDPLVRTTDDIQLLGARVLRRFVLAFDQRHRRVRMDPVVDGPVYTPPRRGTGARLFPRPDHYEVLHVLPDSPAERAGLRAGDRVSRIDGVSAMERRCTDLDDEPPASVRYTVVRDDGETDVDIEVVVLVP